MQTSVAAYHSSVSDEDDRALASMFVAYTVTATFWLLFATAVGVLLAYKFGAPDFAPGEWLTFGRLRPIHTNATFFGWASVALAGLAYYVAARSSGTRLYSVKLAWIGLVLFNVAAIAGTIALDLGYNDGNLEYREWPWPIRLIFLAALVITAWNLIGTVARRNTEDIYLSNWYTIGGVLWTCIIAVVAILPWYQYGLGQVSVSGYYMHNAVGMWFTPLALGIFYYALPKLLSRPIYSYALGVFAFWIRHECDCEGREGAMTIRVLLADDHSVLRDGLAALLHAQDGMTVVAHARDGREAVRKATELKPDVAIMDIAIPELDGIEATRLVHESSPLTQVIILSIYSTTGHIFRALQAGAKGYLLKESAGVELVAAVRSVHAGRRYLSQKITETVVDDYILEHHSTDPLGKLSSRERHILQLVAEGKSTADIAGILFLSPKTIHTYRSRLMQKLDIDGFAGLVKFAIACGLIPP